jgi:hypothetical protein
VITIARCKIGAVPTLVRALAGAALEVFPYTWAAGTNEGVGQLGADSLLAPIQAAMSGPNEAAPGGEMTSVSFA